MRFSLKRPLALDERLIPLEIRGRPLMQFGIRRLLIVVAIVAVVCTIYVAAINYFYADRHHAKSVLGEVKGIGSIKLLSHIDIVEEVNGSSFSVEGQPGSVIAVGGLRTYKDDGSFTVSKIGKWRFRVLGQRHLGNFLENTGVPVESNYLSDHLELGSTSPYKDLIPFEVNTLQDVVDHYAELVDLLESWPRKAIPGSVTLQDGTTQFFYVMEDAE